MTKKEMSDRMRTARSDLDAVQERLSKATRVARWVTGQTELTRRLDDINDRIDRVAGSLEETAK